MKIKYKISFYHFKNKKGVDNLMDFILFIIILIYDVYAIVFWSSRSLKEEEKNIGVGKSWIIFSTIFELFLCTIGAGLVISFLSIMMNGEFHDWYFINRWSMSNFIGLLIHAEWKKKTESSS